MIGQIIPTPKSVSETGYILIVGDSTKAPASPHSATAAKWDYKALSYDPIKQTRLGLAFEVKKHEVEEWQRNQ